MLLGDSRPFFSLTYDDPPPDLDQNVSLRLRLWYFWFMALQGEELVQKAAALAEKWHDGQEHFFW